MPSFHHLTIPAHVAGGLYAIARAADPARGLNRAAIRVTDRGARWEATDGNVLLILEVPTPALPLGLWMLDWPQLNRAAKMPTRWRDGRELDVTLTEDRETGFRAWPDIPALLSVLRPVLTSPPPIHGWRGQALAMPDAVADGLKVPRTRTSRVWRWQHMANGGEATELDPVRLTMHGTCPEVSAVWMLLMPARLD